MVDTSVRTFSHRYAITEFDLDIGDYATLQISSDRASDIRAWWWGEDSAAADLPVVLKTDDRHLVPKREDDVEYSVLRAPDYMIEESEDETFLIPDERHTRLLTGH